MPANHPFKSNSVYIVIGYFELYIFNASKSNMDSYLIPIELYQLISFFYGRYDTFDLHNLGQYHRLKDNVLQQCGGFGSLSTSLFRQEIRNGRHCWQFRTLNDHCNIDIGIWKVNAGNIPMNKWFVKNKNGYCYRVGIADKWYGDEWAKYGKQLAENDIVTMYFDADNLILKYSIKFQKYSTEEIIDMDCGIAYNVEDTVYKAAVCTYSPGASIEFIKYDTY